MSVRRLEAETIRDALLAASGRLSAKMFGPPVPVMPDDVGQIVVGVDTRDSAGRPSGKVVPLGEENSAAASTCKSAARSRWACWNRSTRPLMTPNCEQRASSTVAPQSLLMMNSSFVVAAGRSDGRANRAAKSGDDPAAQFRAGLAAGVFARAVGEPSRRRAWRFSPNRQPRSSPPSPRTDRKADPTASRRRSPWRICARRW